MKNIIIINLIIISHFLFCVDSPVESEYTTPTPFDNTFFEGTYYIDGGQDEYWFIGKIGNNGGISSLVIEEGGTVVCNGGVKSSGDFDVNGKAYGGDNNYKIEFSGNFIGDSLSYTGNGTWKSEFIINGVIVKSDGDWELKNIEPKDSIQLLVSRDSIVLNVYSDTIYLQILNKGITDIYVETSLLKGIPGIKIDEDDKNKKIYVGQPSWIDIYVLSDSLDKNIKTDTLVIIGNDTITIPIIIPFGQWCKTGNSYSSFNNILVDPTNSNTIWGTLYFVGCVKKSINGGQRWETIVDQLGTGPLFEIANSNPDIMITTDGSVFIKSDDGGENWIQIFENSSVLSSVTIDPYDASVIYLGVDNFYYNSAILKSVNGGTTWEETGLKVEEFVNCIAIDPTNTQILYSTSVMSDSAGGLYKTTNGGAEWTKLLFDSTLRIVEIDPQNTSTIYLGSYISGVKKSTDSGQNWTEINNGLTNNNVKDIVINPINSETIYIGTWGGGVFKSTDGGSSWSSMNEGLGNDTIFSLAIDPNDTSTLYVGTKEGAFRYW